MSLENPSEILPTLYVGGRKSARNALFLSTTGITHIFNVAHEVEVEISDDLGMHQFSDESFLTFSSGAAIARTKFGLLDDADQAGNLFGNNPEFEALLGILDQLQREQENGKVLIHCMHGRSRSVFLIVAYVQSINT